MYWKNKIFSLSSTPSFLTSQAPILGVLAVLIAIVITSTVVFLLMIKRNNAKKEKKIYKVAKKLSGKVG